MALNQSNFAADLKAFIKKMNATKQEDQEAAIDAYCQEIESRVFAACKSITITIPSGSIVVATSTGPASNPQPITLNGVVS